MVQAKRIGAILCALMIAFTVATPSALAAKEDNAAGDALKIVKTSPNDGEKNVPLENMGVKVQFNKEVYNTDNEKTNVAACKLVDSKGKEVESMVLFNPKDKTELLVLADTVGEDGSTVTVEAKTEYKLVIDESFVGADGESLGSTQEITFTTLDPSSSMKISMIMMLVMVVAMVFASSRAVKKQKEKEEPYRPKKEEKFNPYKIAKETGRPVEEIIAEENRRREKEAARAARKAKRQHENEEEEIIEEYMEPGHYKVKTVRTVAQGGSSYITGRKAEAEKKAAIEAKIKASKAKGSKGKGKKKKK